MEKWICQLCYHDVESKKHYVCHCTVFFEIEGNTLVSLNKALLNPQGYGYMKTNKHCSC